MVRLSSKPEIRPGEDKRATDAEIKRVFVELLINGDDISKRIATLAFLIILIPAIPHFINDIPYLNNIPRVYHCVIAAAGALLFFCFYFPKREFWYVGIVPGIITGPLIVFLIDLYLSFRVSYFELEVLLPLILGMVPGFAIWALQLYKVFKSDYLKKLRGPYRFNS